jgi:hypothetical protein
MKHMLDTFYGLEMLGKSERQVENVTFVQPVKGEVYFYTPIAFSKEQNGKQVFTDSDLALAGKLKLIFEREKMIWFEIREEKSTTSMKGEHFFTLYYYPHRLVTSRATSSKEKATLQDIKKMFDFIVTEDQTRLAEVRQGQLLLAYGAIIEELLEETDDTTFITEETYAESDDILAASEQH